MYFGQNIPETAFRARVLAVPPSRQRSHVCRRCDLLIFGRPTEAGRIIGMALIFMQFPG